MPDIDPSLPGFVMARQRGHEDRELKDLAGEDASFQNLVLNKKAQQPFKAIALDVARQGHTLDDLSVDVFVSDENRKVLRSVHCFFSSV